MERINTVKFSQLTNWSVLFLTTKAIGYNRDYKLFPIGSFLRPSGESITIKDTEEYVQVTVHTDNGGLEVRDKKNKYKLGKDIGTKKQYRIHSGQFLVSKIDARNGAFGIVPEELDNAIVTHDFPIFNVDGSMLNPEFLLLVTTSNHFKRVSQDCSSGTTNRQRINIKKFLSQRIPVPSKSQQDEIVSKYNQTIAEAKTKEKQASQLKNEIEQYLLSTLGIKQDTQEGNPHLEHLHITNYKQLSQWGYDYLSWNGKSILESKLYPNVLLSKLMDVNPQTSFSSLDKGNDVSFVPMECVSEVYGELKERKVVKVSQSKGFTKFQNGDLIWARITPCMQNGKSAIVNDLQNGFGCGSTEFHVLRNFSSEVMTEYVYCLLRTHYVLEDAKRHFTGSAGQQRVPKSYLNNLAIPLPHIDIQKEIVSHILDMKSAIKFLKQQASDLRKKALSDFENEIFE